MIKAVLIVKGKEPEVIEIKPTLEEYYRVIENNLSDEERNICPIVDGVDFFGVGLPNISGMVESYSACHPYSRNRSWHGPALFTEFDEEGATVSMSEDNINKLMDLYGLSNELKSPSNKINQFVEKFTPDPEIFTVEFEGNVGTLNTYDYLDMILSETDPVQIKNIEEVMDAMTLRAKREKIFVSSLFNDFLKELGKFTFEVKVNEYKFLGF